MRGTEVSLDVISIHVTQGDVQSCLLFINEVEEGG